MAEAPAAVVSRRKRQRLPLRRILFVLIAAGVVGAIYAGWQRREPPQDEAMPARPTTLPVPQQQHAATVEKSSPPQAPAAASSALRQAESARDEAALDRAVAAHSTHAARTTPPTTVGATPAISSVPPESPAVRTTAPTQSGPPALVSRSSAQRVAIGEPQAGRAETGPTSDASPVDDTKQRADRLSGLARLAAQCLAEDKLIEPAGDNAREYLRRLDAADPLVAAPLWQQFAKRLLSKARREQGQGNYDAAEGWLKEAEDTGVIGSEVAAARTELQDARARASFLANVVPASQLKKTKYVPAIYPPKALARGVEGWVELEFTVDATGLVRDIAVKRAVPTGVFEKVAVDALGKWQFQPVIRAGAAVDQRTSVRMQFKLEE